MLNDVAMARDKESLKSTAAGETNGL